MQSFFRSVFVLLVMSSLARADTFGTGENTFEIELVPIGNPGNAADTTGNPNPAGSVDYRYRIGKFEISEGVINRVNALTEAEGNPLEIGHRDWGDNKPAALVSWLDAAQLVNWLNTSKGHAAAYKFDEQDEFQLWQPSDPGYDPGNPLRNAQAFFFLPSTDEWYKAAYYDPAAEVYYDYPTGSDTLPSRVASGTDANTAVYGFDFDFVVPADVMLAGGLSPFGTMAQGGNVFEWLETPIDSPITPEFSRQYRGGDAFFSLGFLRSNIGGISSVPSGTGPFTGFRVASRVPEPSAWLLGLLFSTGALLRKKR